MLEANFPIDISLAFVLIFWRSLIGTVEVLKQELYYISRVILWDYYKIA